jgi:hypothetical protein
MSDYLEKENPDALMGDAERVARDHPVTFLGSSFAAGIAAGRFLRASRARSSGGDGLTHDGGWSQSWRAESGPQWEADASAAGLPHGEPSGFGSPRVGESTSHIEEAKP